MLSSEDMHSKLLKAMETAKKDIRMEEPNRMLTRLAFSLVSELFSQEAPSMFEPPTDLRGINS